MLLLLAELATKPAHTSEVETILRELVDFAANEPGTLYYAVHRQQDQPQTLIVVEQYRDRVACDAHLQSAPVQEALRRFENLLSAPPTIRFADTLAATGIA